MSFYNFCSLSTWNWGWQSNCDPKTYWHYWYYYHPCDQYNLSVTVFGCQEGRRWFFGTRTVDTTMWRKARTRIATATRCWRTTSSTRRTRMMTTMTCHMGRRCRTPRRGLDGVEEGAAVEAADEVVAEAEVGAVAEVGEEAPPLRMLTWWRTAMPPFLRNEWKITSLPMWIPDAYSMFYVEDEQILPTW